MVSQGSSNLYLFYDAPPGHSSFSPFFASRNQCSIMSEHPVLAATSKGFWFALLLPEASFADTPRNQEPGHLFSLPAHILFLLHCSQVFGC